ncbi:MAG: type II secretion system F family protein [Actinomycetota bacterium]
MTFFAAILLASGAAIFVLAFRKIPQPAVANAETTWNRVSARRKPALLEAAGLVYGTDRELSKLARQQVVATLTLGGFAALLIASSPSPTTVLAAIPMVLLGWKGPLMIVRSREKKRQTHVDLGLVDALGEMVMGVEAGLTLDVVMMRYAHASTTPLAEEFRTVLDRIQLGTPRSEALSVMADRTPTPTVRMFSTALTQNQRLGTPLAGVLRQQATTARRQRRQTVEEKAAKVPMKMIFPTVFCILPVLMIVVVGPAIIRLIDVLP